MCILRTCTQARQSGDHYCIGRTYSETSGRGHSELTCLPDTCEEPRCRNLRSKPDNASVRYCDVHECQEDGCVRHAEVIKGYCQTHKCLDAICSSSRASARSPYCKDHECHSAECFAVTTMPGGYCEMNRHACTSRGCPNPSVTHGRPPALCIDHFGRAQREAAALDVNSEYIDEIERLQAEVERRAQQQWRRSQYGEPRYVPQQPPELGVHNAYSSDESQDSYSSYPELHQRPTYRQYVEARGGHRYGQPTRRNTRYGRS